MNWTLARAKDQLSEVVRRAIDQGPQIISVRGKDAAVLLSAAEYDALRTPRYRDFKAWLLAVPDLEGVDLERNPEPSRDVEL